MDATDRNAVIAELPPTRRWTRNATGQILFDGKPLFLVVRAQWGDDATPAATLYGIERAIVEQLNAAKIVP